jgi:hypothetical protein
MSRTKTGAKGPGHEYWGRRPGPRDPGRFSKTITHRCERRASRKAERNYEG